MQNLRLMKGMRLKNQDKEDVIICNEGKHDEIMSFQMVKQERLRHLKPIFPNFEVGSGVCEAFGSGNKTRERPNLT